MFVLRNYRKGDFEVLYAIDRECFDPGIAYSRSELQSFIERKQSFCIVAEVQAGAIATQDPNSTEEVLPVAPGGNPKPEILHPSKRERVCRGPRIAGFILIEIHHQGYGHVITIDVPREHRRRRLGTLLLQAAEERVRKIGGFMMVLETAVNNDAALAFYKTHKYKVIHRLPGYYGKRLDAWFLSKRL